MRGWESPRNRPRGMYARDALLNPLAGIEAAVRISRPWQLHERVTSKATRFELPTPSVFSLRQPMASRAASTERRVSAL